MTTTHPTIHKRKADDALGSSSSPSSSTSSSSPTTPGSLLKNCPGLNKKIRLDVEKKTEEIHGNTSEGFDLQKYAPLVSLIIYAISCASDKKLLRKIKSAQNSFPDYIVPTTVGDVDVSMLVSEVLTSFTGQSASPLTEKNFVRTDPATEKITEPFHAILTEIDNNGSTFNKQEITLFQKLIPGVVILKNSKSQHLSSTSADTETLLVNIISRSQNKLDSSSSTTSSNRKNKNGGGKRKNKNSASSKEQMELFGNDDDDEEENEDGEYDNQQDES